MPQKKGQQFMCLVAGCGHVYTQMAHLKRHNKISHLKQTESYSKCPVETCGKVFTYVQNMKKHVRRTHGNPYRCEECDMNFRKHSLLTAHKMHHLNQPGFECSEPGCDQKFFQQRQLKSHIKGHKAYMCDVDGCDVIVDKWTALRKHKKLSHFYEYKCAVCSRMFTIKGNFLQHKKIHKESREVFACTQEGCSRYYYHKKNLNNHEKTAHEGILHECTHEGCDRKFTANRNLVQHLKLHSSGNSVLKKNKKKRKQGSRKPRKDKGVPHTPMIVKLLGDPLNSLPEGLIKAEEGKGATEEKPIEVKVKVEEEEVEFIKNVAYDKAGCKKAEEFSYRKCSDKEAKSRYVMAAPDVADSVAFTEMSKQAVQVSS